MGTETNVSVLTVACVYKPGSGFTDDYVYRLKKAVNDNFHASCDYQFVCLTDQKLKGIETIPFDQRRYGFWNKLSLFQSGIFDGAVAYLDLDTMIVNDVTDILTYPHKFTTGLNFKSKHGRTLASWFLGFDGREDYSYLIDGYTNQTPTDYEQDWARWGDQGYIQDHLKCDWDSLDDLYFDGRYASYKWQIRRPGKVPEGVSFVCFHGKPRPHEVEWRLPNGD